MYANWFFLLVPHGSKMMPKRIAGWKGSSQEMMSIGWGHSGMFRSWFTISGNKHERNIGVIFFSFFLGSECAIAAKTHYLLSQQMSKCKMSIEKHVFGCFWMFLDVFGEFVLFCLVRCSVSSLLHSHNLDISWYKKIYCCMIYDISIIIRY